MTPFTKRLKFLIQQPSQRSSQPIFKRTLLPWLSSPVRRTESLLKSSFLPRDFPKTVHPNYLPFCVGQFVYTGSSTICNILATQSLLQSLGLVSAAGSGAAVSATVAWILKDGLGQFGGVLYASRANVKFDSNPKNIRFHAILLLQLGAIIEWSTVYFDPVWFLPLAATSNVLKNISWLGLSATRAQINKVFAQRDNLGDLTGKGGSQSTAASLIG